MAIDKPKNVTLHNGCLAWSPVPCADGYNIHVNNEYHETVYTNKFTVNKPGKYAVSAFIRGKDGELHGSKTKAESLKMKCPRILHPMSVPPDVMAEYTNLVFDDGFDLGYLDPLKWQTRQPWGPDTIVNNEAQYYVDTLSPVNTNNYDPFSFNNGVLTITADNATPGPENNGQAYESGILTTFDTFRFTYGLMSWCFRGPCDAAGFWAAFWAFATNFSSNEIDVTELVGNSAYGDLMANWQAYHHTTAANPGTLSSLDANRYNGGQIVSCNGDVYDNNNGWNLPMINCGEFNTAAAVWEPGKLVLYVNGVEVNSICGSQVTDAEMYLIANLAVGGVLGGAPNPAAFPATLEIEHIRVYQK